MFRIGIRMQGQTANVVKRMSEASVRDVIDRPALQAFARSVAEEIQTEADIGNFVPLSVETIRAKASRGSGTPDKPWFERPFLVEHLFLKPVVRFYKSGSVTVTLPTSSQPHPRTKEALSTIFGYLEQGAGKIPPRPIMAPVFERLESGQSALVSELQSTIKDKMEKMFQ
jgi:hypothetical protein